MNGFACSSENRRLASFKATSNASHFPAHFPDFATVGYFKSGSPTLPSSIERAKTVFEYRNSN